MDFTKRKARVAKIQEANAQVNPRIKSLKLSGSRLAVRIARQAMSSNTSRDLVKFSVAQSTIAIAMGIVDADPQRANRLLDMARSLANGNLKKEITNG